MVEEMIPKIESREGKLKQNIIKLLMQENILSTSQLHNLLEKQMSISISYQAVHKTLKQMIEEKILEKNTKNYSINNDWVKELKQFTSSLENSLNEKKSPDAQTINLTFNSVYELYQFVLKRFDAATATTNDTTIACAQLEHLYRWCPLTASKREHEIIKKFSQKINAFVACNGKTTADEWVSEYYQKAGWKTKLGAKCSNSSDIIVHDDTLVQVFFPQQVKTMFKQKLEKAKNISQLNINEIYDVIFHTKTQIPVIITKNKLLAQNIFNQTKTFFE